MEISTKCLLFAVAVLVVVLLFTLPQVLEMRHSERPDIAVNETTNLCAAIRLYWEHIGTLPTGTNGEIFLALSGRNPRKIVFYELRAREMQRLSPSNELRDPWGTPYRIDQSDPTRTRVSSAGRNRKFQNDDPKSDDIVREWKYPAEALRN